LKGVRIFFVDLAWNDPDALMQLMRKIQDGGKHAQPEGSRIALM